MVRETLAPTLHAIQAPHQVSSNYAKRLSKRRLRSAEITTLESGLQEAPEEGEVVLATVKDINPHGVYVSLDEYGGLPGFLHISEISSGWVRHIERFAKPGQKIVLKVIRVSKARKEVDLSLRQVTGDEKKEKLIEVRKTEKARTIFEGITAKLNLPVEEAHRYSTLLTDEFGSLYDALEETAKKGVKALEGLALPTGHITIIEAAAREKIVIPMVEVRGVIEASSTRPDGINVIKGALTAAESVKSGGAQVKVTYMGAPKYRIIVQAENFKIAEKVLESALQKTQNVLEKHKGLFKFTREESRKRAGE